MASYVQQLREKINQIKEMIKMGEEYNTFMPLYLLRLDYITKQLEKESLELESKEE